MALYRSGTCIAQPTTIHQEQYRNQARPQLLDPDVADNVVAAAAVAAAGLSALAVVADQVWSSSSSLSSWQAHTPRIRHRIKQQIFSNEAPQKILSTLTNT